MTTQLTPKPLPRSLEEVEMMTSFMKDMFRPIEDKMVEDLFQTVIPEHNQRSLKDRVFEQLPAVMTSAIVEKTKSTDVSKKEDFMRLVGPQMHDIVIQKVSNIIYSVLPQDAKEGARKKLDAYFNPQKAALSAPGVIFQLVEEQEKITNFSFLGFFFKYLLFKEKLRVA